MGTGHAWEGGGAGHGEVGKRVGELGSHFLLQLEVLLHTQERLHHDGTEGVAVRAGGILGV